MDKIIVDYDLSTSRFHIHSPPWMVERMRAIPNRRWDAKRRVWTAPVLKANVEHLTRTMSPEMFTDAASRVLADYSKPKTSTADRFPLSYEFKVPPMQHQLGGMDKVYGLNEFALFMDPRTGKTKVVIDTFCAMNKVDKCELLVVVCPNSLKINWRIEFEANATVPYMLHILETTKKKDFEAWVGTAHPFKVLVVAVESFSAGSAAALVERAMLTAINVGMVIDESHKIKNHAANRSKVLVKMGNMATKRGILTGSPITNGPMDYFMQFEFLNPDIIGIGDFYSFRNRYAIMGGFNNKEIIGYQNTDELMELISPHIYQVRRSDVFHALPPKEYEVRTVEMTAVQRKLYDSLRRSKKATIGDNTSEVQNALTLMGRLQEVTAGVFSYGNPKFDGVEDKVKYYHSPIEGINPKITELLNVVDEEPGNIIVWAMYELEIACIVTALREKYGHESVVEVHGGIPNEQRDYNVRHLFQTKKARFLVGNAATGSAGHEMSAAETIVYMTNSFNYVDRLQSEDRASSSAQKSVVKVVDILCDNSVDEVVREALINKQDVATYVSNKIREILARV